MLEVKVTIETPDLSEAVIKLAAALEHKMTVPIPAVETTPAVVPLEKPAEAPAEPIQAQEQVSAQNVTPTTAAPVEAPTATQELPVPEPEPELTLDTISRAGAALVDQGKMQDVLKILQEKYGVFAVTQLRPEQYKLFADDLRALGAKI